MKLVHIQLTSPYVPDTGYQENLLARKHKQLGFDVTVITHNNDYGEVFYDDDIPIYNLQTKEITFSYRIPYLGLLRERYLGFLDKLEEISPDYIFVHGTYWPDYLVLTKYKHRHPNIKVYADSHVDYYNWPVNSLQTWIMKKVIYRFISRRLARICEKVWGVSPWRVKYLNDVLGVPKKKIGLLEMGGDECFIDWDKRFEIKFEIRNKYCIPQDAFVVVSGGRIDKAKNIHLLIDAILELDNPNVYLLIFGKYLDDMKDYAAINNKHIVNAGWLPSSESYPMFIASDLGCFPGTHSVLWEQACASGLPCIFQYWDGGFSHVDVGGNCMFLKNVTKVELADTINEMITDTYKLQKMKDVASRKARKIFSYVEIAKRSVGLQ